MGTFSEELKTFWDTFYGDETITIISSIKMKTKVKPTRIIQHLNQIEKMCDIIRVDKSLPIPDDANEYREKFLDSKFDALSEPFSDSIPGLFLDIMNSYFICNDFIRIRIEMKHSYSDPVVCKVKWYIDTFDTPENISSQCIEFKIHKDPITGRLRMLAVEFPKEIFVIDAMSKIGSYMMSILHKLNFGVTSEWDHDNHDGKYINRVIRYIIGSRRYGILPLNQLRIEQNIELSNDPHYLAIVDDSLYIKTPDQIFQLYPQGFTNKYMYLYQPEFRFQSTEYSSYDAMMKQLGLQMLYEPYLFQGGVTKVTLKARYDIWNTTRNIIIVFSLGMKKESGDEDTLFVVTMNTSHDDSLLTTNVAYNDMYLNVSDQLTLREELHVAACEYLYKLNSRRI